jgi:hypothetical protein
MIVVILAEVDRYLPKWIGTIGTTVRSLLLAIYPSWATVLPCSMNGVTS